VSPRARRIVWQVRTFITAVALSGLVALSGQHTADVSEAPPIDVRVASTQNGCVDRWEYHTLHEGMTRERVARHVGSRGRHAEGWPGRSRMYDTCGRSAWVIVRYGHHDRVRDYYRIGHD